LLSSRIFADIWLACVLASGYQLAIDSDERVHDPTPR
jgi:hypothetical protein